MSKVNKDTESNKKGKSNVTLASILFFLAIGFFLIGLFEVFTNGFVGSYWLFMISFGLILWSRYQRKNEN
ncbi:hypothetical protein [Marinigracilibium pacificum]|uniref:Uncharacterized protein n=1 Tax=Marinigracilibium pacificum TaxID=2729599 RepID=A0A848ISW9_9BACT|nr:hypothetical protein [Marinigracilibium pacificum]NMM46876.1 hypothetical protein [Marinigracilibium pacificum]